MSRAYRVAVSGSIERVVHIEDGVCGSLELLPILPKERMRDLLASELSRRGFTIEGNIAKKIPTGGESGADEGITIEVDLDASTVSVKVDGQVALDLHREEARRLADRPSRETETRARESLQREVDKKLEEAAAVEVERGQRLIAQKLEGKLRDLKIEIDDAINRVTGEALKEKARTMGEIEEISEDPATGSLTIKVKL